MKALEIVIIAVNQADALGAGKDEAKTLLRILLVSKAAVSVSGPGTQSLVAKYFTQSSRQRPPKIRLASFCPGFARQETVTLSENTLRPYSKTT
jgi:hypothetical protein